MRHWPEMALFAECCAEVDKKGTRTISMASFFANFEKVFNISHCLYY